MKTIAKLMAAISLLFGSPAVAQGIGGRWSGEAWLREDRMPVELELREEEAEIRAELALPDMIWRAEVEATAVPDGLEVTLPFGIGPTPLRLSRDGHVLATLANSLRLTLRRVDAVPYAVEEVAIPTPAGVLAATLFLPPGDSSVPAVLLAGGALAESRHHPSVVAWCHHFVRRNFACLIADRRPDGEGPSGEPDLQRDAEDLGDALRFLRTHARTDPDRVGLAAFSRGGWPALRLAAGDRQLAFLLLIAPPALRPAETEKASVRARMEAAGRTPAEIRSAERYYQLYFDVAAGRTEWPLLERAARAVEGTELGEFLDQPLEPGHLAFWARNGEFSNAADLARVTAPVLAVWGGADSIVPPDVHEPLLRAGLANAHSVRMLVFSGADHSVETQPGRDRLGVWRWPSRARGLVPAIDSWLIEVLPGADANEPAVN